MRQAEPLNLRRRRGERDRLQSRPHPLRPLPRLTQQKSIVQVTHTLALIDWVVILKISDIRLEHNFRSIRQRIFEIADSQIALYKKIENGDLVIDDQIDDEVVGPEEDEIGDGWAALIDSDSDGERELESDDTECNEKVQPPDTRKDPRIMRGYLFGLEHVKVLEDKLSTRWDFLLKYELIDGHLVVRSVPGLPHETSSMYFNNELTNWSVIPGAQDNDKYTLHSAGSASKLPFIL